MNVEKTLSRFSQDLRTLLGNNLVDIIIHGSYALGDFRPGKGDLDYIVVTEGDLDDEINDRLFKLHEGYRRQKELLLHQLEGTFYPRRVLEDPRSEFVGCYIGTGRSGWRTITSFQNGWFDLLVASDHGISLLGAGLPIYRPERSDLLDQIHKDLQSWRAAVTAGVGRSSGFSFSIVHWCARTVCYLRRGGVASKGDACRWCASDAATQDFADVFLQAEDRRYPYSDDPPPESVEAAADLLLDIVEEIL